ncbi:Guanylate cyclase [Seminavis robusta]|uniref:Guanylate cyclase n=1 Tax=Seminavis robusta TaxID=568900 RepID=A0A9N8H448_9STRA|nr:Guanylate cyclase [Seminavis robusta]|eukprot:Sro4_g003380.1 Guanylate cyclase (585) ;mRNA; r:134949-136703
MKVSQGCIAVWALLSAVGGYASSATDSEDPSASTSTSTNDNINPRVPPGCSLVMAPSSIPNSGWGVFSMVDSKVGDPIIAGDLVIQVADLNVTHASDMRRIVYDYAWNAAETGGQYEGINVLSVIPGIGMLANGASEEGILPVLEPSVDEAGVTRHKSPGAGAFTHYFNYTFHFNKPLVAGNEILVNYGPGYFQMRNNQMANEKEEDEEEGAKQPQLLHRSLESLHETGFCLDNLKPGKSTIEHAGRGAFASRGQAKGSVVAPVPVLPITKREAMDVTRKKQVSKKEFAETTTKQLLTNYCYGHPKSSVLLFPYSPMVNLINHSSKRSNVRLQWSSKSQPTLEHLQDINKKPTASTDGLLLELVATEDIQEGEEVLLDYGPEWQAAWEKHVKQWEPYPFEYAPGYVLDEAVPVLGTQEEVQGSKPYPPNLLTSCFYPYVHPETKPSEGEDDEKNDPTRNITSAEWRHMPGIFELRNLRPCTIMQRYEVEKDKDSSSGDSEDPSNFYYTVVIRNRYGLAPQERILPGQMHVVTRVPRRAIRFTDKVYTTDQHLQNAFRKEIGLSDELFRNWMDLDGKSDSEEKDL